MSENQFSEASHLSDAVLVVEGKRLFVNKAVLSLASPVFDRMFHGGFKERKTSEIPLPGKKYDHVVEFLSCIYTSSAKTVTRENMDIVMPLAEEYQVWCIKDTCDTLIETIVFFKNPGPAELVHLAYVAGQYELPKSMKTCADVASTKMLRELWKVKEFEHVSPEIKYGIASRRLVRYENGCDQLEKDLRYISPCCQRLVSYERDEKVKDMQKLMNNFHN